MPKPCSLELRERVVDAVESGASRREAADWFDVSPSSAIKWMQRLLIPLKQIKVGDMVIGKSGHPARVTASIDKGMLPALRIETASARVIHPAHDHPFLTPNG